MKRPEARVRTTPVDEFVPRTYPIRDEIAFQRKSWRLERLGWFGLVLLMLLTLLGVFSKGPLSTRHISSADGTLHVEYQRFLRHGAHSRLIVTARSAPSGSAVLQFSAQLLEAFTLEGIHPEPQSSASRQGGLLLESRADAQGGVTLYLALRPEALGPVEHSISLNGQTVQFVQFIYP